MQTWRNSKPLIISLSFHAFVGWLLLSQTGRKLHPEPTQGIAIEMIPSGSNSASYSDFPKKGIAKHSGKANSRSPNIDLRPRFLKDGSLFAKSKRPETTPEDSTETNHLDSISNPYARDFLLTEPKVFKAFDLLAEKINQYIDYPMILVENDLQGIATFELYFDQEGNIDEIKSKFFGDNRWVRGLLVRASRQGLVKWYLSDALRLKKSQFKNQHFRAEFEISYTLPNASRVEANSPGSYTILRRHYIYECANPAGVDIACLAMKVHGAMQRGLSSSYKIRLEALRDQLEHFDNIGLSGIGVTIRGA